MSVQKIPLHDLHVSLGGKMVPFAGFEMPVRYTSDKEEHLKVRNAVGVFDVSHMGEFMITGSGALDLIQYVTSNDASKLKIGQSQYSCLPNEQGGIVDDLIVYKLAGEKYMLVVNAGNIQKDWEWINQHNTFGAQLDDISAQTVLFAVQGPNAQACLQSLTETDLSSIPFYHFAEGQLAGHPMIISATGYTGAGGFELYMDKTHAQDVWNQIFEAGAAYDISPIGLGARDTLRLEMGYCLYGNDINDTTSPIEAGLGWITKFNKDFINAANLKVQKENGITKKLVAFKMTEKGIPRHDYAILDESGTEIGIVTSGTISPVLNIGIGLGYVPTDFATPNTPIRIAVRNKMLLAEVTKLPFIQ